MISIPVRREPDRKAYDSRAIFYADGPSRGQGPPFCKVLELSSPHLQRFRAEGRGSSWRGVPWVTLVVGSGCLELPDDPALDTKRLTAEIEQLIGAVVESEKDARFRAFDNSVIGRGVSETKHASDFAEALILDRLQSAPCKGPVSDDVKVVPTTDASGMSLLAARFVLLASQLTRLYYESMARAEQPLSRWEADTAVLHRSRAGGLQPYIELCQWHCAQAMTDLTRGARPERLTDDMAAAIRDLLGAVQAGVGMPGSTMTDTTIVLLYLRLITEIAWYLMTMELGAYPGWTELLFGLLLREKPAALGRSRPRPSRLRRENQSDPIGSLLLPASEQSWSARAARAVSPRSTFYDAVAKVLWKQSRVVRGEAGAVRPPATAFVTSFDVEVEMAMWAAAKEGDSFYVVVPVHVFQGEADNTARPCWLRGEIRRTANPHPSLEELCRPLAWEVLSATDDPRKLQAGPHVVHLSGAPLISLPGDDGLWADPRPVGEIRKILGDIWQGLRDLGMTIELRVEEEKDEEGEENERDSTKDMLIEHAVTTDEYLAVRQAEVELLLTALDDKDTAVRRNRSLPPYLTMSNADGEPGKGENPRFWMVVGVPISDPAIRHRLVSQLSPKRPTRDAFVEDGRSGPPGNGQGAASTQVDGGSAPGRSIDPLGLESTADRASDEVVDPSRLLTGIVVNRRIADDQGHLLYWMGFDVVRDTAASFTTDLLHYAAHLQADGWRDWPYEQGACRVDSGARR